MDRLTLNYFKNLKLDNINDLYCINAYSLKIDKFMPNCEFMAQKVHVDIVTALTRYKERIQVEYEDEFAGEHKQSLIGRKWSKTNAIGQLDFVICKI